MTPASASRRAVRRYAAALLFGFGLGSAAAQVAEVARGPRMDFVPPAPGSYTLATIQPAAEGRVLTSSGALDRLSRYTRGSITLLTFMYTYCSDPVGCPLAYETMMELQKRVLADPRLSGKVRFVSLSFDPTNDTPDAMYRYGGASAKPGAALPWHFLTTRSVADLKPILDDFGQDVEVERDAKGRATRTVNHMLKVFLIDRSGTVREIYSTAFLMPAVVLNDITTLVMENASGSGRTH